MTKRDTRRALTRLFADRDAAVTAYALAFLEKEKLRRRLAGLDDDLKELKRKAREAGARAGDLEAAEQAMIQDLDDTAPDADGQGDAPQTASTSPDDPASGDMPETLDPVPGDPAGVAGPVGDGTDGSPAAAGENVAPDGGGY